jgi:hypothetical protein
MAFAKISLWSSLAVHIHPGPAGKGVTLIFTASPIARWHDRWDRLLCINSSLRSGVSLARSLLIGFGGLGIDRYHALQSSKRNNEAYCTICWSTLTLTFPPMPLVKCEHLPLRQVSCIACLARKPPNLPSHDSDAARFRRRMPGLCPDNLHPTPRYCKHPRFY